MLANTLCMCLHQSFSLSIILSSKGIRIGSKRNLRVDNHTSSFRESDDDIRAEILAILVLGIFLDKELLVFSQSAILQDGFQDHFSPVTLHLTITLQCLGEIGCIRTNLGRLLFQAQYSLLLFLLKEFHRSLEGILQFFLVYFILRFALLHRFLEISKLFLNRFQEFIHLQTVVFLQSRLLGSQLFRCHPLLLDIHPLHLLLEVFEFLRPLLVALCPKFRSILSLVLHLSFQGMNLRSMRFFHTFHLRSMM